MKKIVFLCNTINYGGSTIATVNMAFQLPLFAVNYETYILDVNGSCDALVSVCKKKGINLVIAVPNKMPRILSSNHRIKTIINKIKFIPEYFTTKKKIHKILNEMNPDFICVSSERTLSYLDGYKKKNAKIVFIAHFWYLKKQIPHNLARLFKHVVDRFICVSNATRQALYNNGIANLENLYVSHNSINEESTKVGPAVITDRNGKCIILHCGGFTKGKGQHISIEIAKQLKTEGVPFKMVFTGLIYKGQESKEYYNKLVKLVKKYDLTKDVEFVVGHTNVYDYMQACDILIHPSSTEGFPLVVLEAQIMRKPVIVNGVGGVTDMVLDGFTGFIAEYNNIESYVDKIKQLQNEELYDFITNNAYLLASRSFTVEEQIKSTINALQ
ncbi:MAG: glycosyltransferase family 4 protein [Bacteroidales bacterium]|nr:glycosyltransferase family 4 protein [Bacteroidales bacterium]